MAVPLTYRTEPIPGYKLLERLGRGGFGEVWKCEAPGGIFKAIKFVYGDLDGVGDEGKPAEQEHRSLDRVKQVRHPFILSLERIEVIDGQLLIVMELADRNLWDRFRECRAQGLPGIPREELLRLMEEAAEALDLMNQEYNLQHLDIKPQNLFLVHSHLKVADFGLVKDLEGLSASVTGGVTPVYAAPETFEERVTRYSDQYSLAIVYQELLTGVRPFNGSNTKQLVLQHLTQPPDLAPLPEGDRAAIGRALSKKPDERFPSCTALVQMLRQSAATTPLPGGSTLARATARPAKTPPPASAPVPTSRLRAPAAPGQKARESAITQIFRAPATQHRPPAASMTVSQLAPDLKATPEEKTGDGVLRPAVVLGAGHLGGRVLRRVRAAIAERFGSAEATPHVRLLALETDPDAARAAITLRAAPLDAREVFVARLYRPSHYLQARGGSPGEGWLDPDLLYRIPRNPATAGLRALGRLAFCDHVRDLRGRLRAELEAGLAPDALTEAERQTQLGLRTNRPRVYVVAGLGGGTGAGMVLDLAYLARAELRRLGYEQPEIVGVLLLPAADRASAKSPALANAHAALAELIHYSAADSTYRLNLGARESPLADAEPPFSRCLLVPLPTGADGQALGVAAGSAAGLIVRDLFSPLGRAADEARTAASAERRAGASFQTASAYRLSWPRRRLLGRAAGLLAGQLLAQWTAREAPEALRDAVRAWLDEQWASRQLAPDAVIDRLHAAAAAALGGPEPDVKFDAVVAPLAERGRLGTPLDALSACQVLDDLIALVGKPPREGEDDPPPGPLHKALDLAVQSFGPEYDQKLAEMAVHFIERPQYRLPAAEETVRQLTERLRQVLATYEGLHKTLEREAAECYGRLFPLIAALKANPTGARKTAVAAAEVVDLLRAYPKKRYQMMVARYVMGVFRSMLNSAPEYLREVNFCRQRLGEAAAALASTDSTAGGGLGPGQDLFPGGGTLDDAAARVVAGLTDEAWQDFDNRVQGQVRKQFKALITLCLEGTSPAGPLADVLYRQAEEFLDPHLGQYDPAEVFFEHHPDEQAAGRDLARAFDEALPELAAPKASAAGAVTFLAAPPGPAGDRLRALARQVLPEVAVLDAACADEIVVYREQRALTPADLPQLGPVGREAYEHALASGHPPHARTDVEWAPVGR